MASTTLVALCAGSGLGAAHGVLVRHPGHYHHGASTQRSSVLCICLFGRLHGCITCPIILLQRAADSTSHTVPPHCPLICPFNCPFSYLSTFTSIYMYVYIHACILCSQFTCTIACLFTTPTQGPCLSQNCSSLPHYLPKLHTHLPKLDSHDWPTHPKHTRHFTELRLAAQLLVRQLRQRPA